MTAEVWRGIPFAPDYEVSNLGRVRSLPRVIMRSNGRPQTIRGRILGQRLLQTSTNSSRYLGVHLVIDGWSTTVKVHRCVGEAFLGPLPAGMETRHLNGIATDNRLENLAYGTHSENVADQVVHGTHHMARRTHCKRAGHELTPENTLISRGSRRCRECSRQDGFKAWRKRRALKIAAREAEQEAS